MERKQTGVLRIALVGTGFIANIHKDILNGIKEAKVVAVCDLDYEKGKSFCEKWDISKCYRSMERLVEDNDLDVAHILVPPPNHFRLAHFFLENGVNVFIEKPMTISSQDARSLIFLAEGNRVRIGVNHNYLFQPVFRQLMKDLKKLNVGKLEHVISVNKIPLRQLSSGQYGHWMFQDPQNIIFEQASHPFSQIYALLGMVREIQVVPSGKRELGKGSLEFYDTWQFLLTCEEGTAYVSISFSKGIPENRMHIIGRDGSIEIDFQNNLFFLHDSSKWPEALNTFRDTGRQTIDAAKGAVRNIVNYGLSFARVKGRTDSFFAGMKGCITNFYSALLKNEPIYSSGELGLAVVEFCEKAASVVKVGNENSRSIRKVEHLDKPKDEILIIGGTGFIGRHLIRALVREGFNIRLMARNPAIIPNEFNHERIRVVQGNILDEKSIAQSVQGVSVVYYLAAGEGDSWSNIRKTMVGGLANVAEACVKGKVEQFHYASSIAALYLGDQLEIDEDTPVDLHPQKRGPYARAKIECEKILVEMHEKMNLPVIIYRPGFVIGEGGQPFHSGIGLWVNELHCIGWGKGENDLPFVLVEDVASALVKGLTERETVQCFNLIGDVRMSAREYVRLLAETLQRNIHFYPRTILALYAKEILKWALKRNIRRIDAEFPSYRDLKTRGILSSFNCQRTKERLKWTPVNDRGNFIDRGIRCYKVNHS